MRRICSPFWKRRTVPLDSLTAIATLFVFLVIAAAAQWREPRPLLSVISFAGAFINEPYEQARDKILAATIAAMNAEG